MQDDVIVYGDKRSTYVRTVLMTCEEKGIAYQSQRMAPHSEELLALNPFGKIPAFRHGDLVLHETSAITRYIDEAFPGPPLQPSDVVERAHMNRWIGAVEDYIYEWMVRRYLLQYLFPTGEGGEPDRAAIEKAAQVISTQLEVIDRAYGDRRFLVGDTISLADLFLVPVLSYLREMPEGSSLIADRPAISSAWDAVAGRESFVRTKPDLTHR
jgi:glutathione S-transferase